MGVCVKVASNGRLSLPAALRKRLGIAKGGDVMIEETEGGLLIRTKEQVVTDFRRRMRELTQGKAGFSVDDFIAEKRREAAREDEKSGK